MQHTNLQVTTLVLGAALLMSACSGELNDYREPKSTPDDPEQTAEEMDLPFDEMAPPSEDMFTQPDMRGPDMPAPLPEDMGPDMTQDMCLPRTTCPAEQCGAIDDGCGGTLDCGDCGCLDGQVVIAECGACGWGERRCDTAGAGGQQGTCSLPELLVEPADCDDVIHLSSQTPPVSAPTGSKQAPFATLSEALAGARIKGSDFIIVEAGEYDSAGVTLLNGVSILGGFKAGFTYDPAGESRFSFTPTEDQGQAHSIAAIDLTETTWLSQLHVRSGEAPVGANLYAIYARNSGGLHLSHVTLERGSAGRGADGRPGENGRVGPDGGDADQRTTLAARAVQPLPGKSVNGANGGAAGLNPDCAIANGGVGGEGAHIRYEDPSSPNGAITAVPASAGGENGVGFNGGAAGTRLSPNGQNGRNGYAGLPGEAGYKGEAQGSVTLGYWSAAKRDGRDGAQGSAGSGGSGGGGSFWKSEQAPVYDSEPGVSGGGGGAGGCGGFGGGGGKGAGSAFGMLLVDSSGIVLEEVTLEGPDAADGGAGAIGGQGGRGGKGGDPSTLFAILPTSSSTSDHPHTAGWGGNGQPGGPGGLGGGGAGGNAYGVYCENTQVMRTGGVMVRAGEAGSGGPGAEPGEDGTRQDVVGCW